MELIRQVSDDAHDQRKVPLTTSPCRYAFEVVPLDGPGTMNCGGVNVDGSQGAFDLFRKAVLKDRALQARLRSELDDTAFGIFVKQVGAECGYEFTEDDVRAALQASRRAWMERWLT